MPVDGRGPSGGDLSEIKDPNPSPHLANVKSVKSVSK